MKLPPVEEMYGAIERRDRQYVGVFYIAVRTTKIFCRPGCPARVPLLKNLEFFAHPREALYAGYRPCKRCKPLDAIEETPDWARAAIELVERDPERRVRDQDLRNIQVEPERVRRYFKSKFGMTFHAYARGRRLGGAFAKLREGQDVIEAGMDSGYDSTSGFREAFAKAFGKPPSKASGGMLLHMRWLETPLGPMVAAADENALYLLEFVDRRMLPAQLESIQRRLGCDFAPGTNPILTQIESELAAYFHGELSEFATPISAPGSPFQVLVWKHLRDVPYGQTASYGALAKTIGHPDASRAVGKANGENRIAIVIPCHRIIGADGKLTGYGGGVWRKQRLLELESGQGKLV